jgi:hypothetical protein
LFLDPPRRVVIVVVTVAPGTLGAFRTAGSNARFLRPARFRGTSGGPSRRRRLRIDKEDGVALSAADLLTVQLVGHLV